MRTAAERFHTLTASRPGRVTCVILSIACAACHGGVQKIASTQPTTLTIGFGLVAGTDPEIGIQQVARSIAVEDLAVVAPDGATLAKLAESWSASPDGLTLRIHLRPSATFHSGKPVDAASVRQILERLLPASMGPSYKDIASIRAVTREDIEVSLHHRSAFLLEALGTTAIREPTTSLSGTGPFFVTSDKNGEIEMRANERYYGGKPPVDRIVVKPFTSLRSAWAEMLRGRVDVLYDVGVDGIDSLESSSDVDIFTLQRGAYAFLMLLNVKSPTLSDAAFRRQLNAAIDRDALVQQVWSGHGTPADGPIWTRHWAYGRDFPRFTYDPVPGTRGAGVRRFKCLIVDPSHERLALAVQRQLQGIGVEVEFEFIPLDEVLSRLRAGNFDAVLADYWLGPNMVKQYLAWYTGAPSNFGRYSNTDVDAALDAVRLASGDDAYRTGVAAFQRAIVNDPPAIFLTWRERARAVSRRFRVPEIPPGIDVWTTLRAWTPVTRPGRMTAN